MQASLNVLLPNATQSDPVVQAVPAPRAVFGELIRQAGQGDLLLCDNTRAKALSLIVAGNQLEAAGLATCERLLLHNLLQTCVPNP